MRAFLAPNNDTRVIIVIGKGGVGKTTLSASIATSLAECGYKTHIISLDPAHNLGDVLGHNLSSTPTMIKENLYASELDLDMLVKKYLKNLSLSLKSMYRYLTVLNLEKYFDVLSYSPGIEEYATLDALMEIIKNRRSWDIIVLDTPPTGLTLRVLGLPKISVIWVEKLIELRGLILEKREIIEKIKASPTQEGSLPSREEDPVIKELKNYYKDVLDVFEFLKDENRTTIIGVVNPDKLSFFEMKRARDFLEKVDLKIKMLIVNKIFKESYLKEELSEILKIQKEVLSDIEKQFSDLDIVKVYYSEKEPRGLGGLLNLGKVIIGEC